jgi:hypothetical protein
MRYGLARGAFITVAALAATACSAGTPATPATTTAPASPAGAASAAQPETVAAARAVAEQYFGLYSAS